MNKIITCLCAVLATALTASAKSQVGNLYYYLGETTAQVAPNSGGKLVGPITVPQTITVDGKTYTVNGISQSAFQYEDEMTSVTLPSTIETIGEYAFCACYAMESINLQDTKIKELPYGAFGACWGLKYVTLPATLINIVDNPFYMPTNLLAFYVAEGNPAYKAVDGALYTISGKTLIAYPFGKTLNVVIPEGVDSIQNECMMNFRSMRTCQLPSSLIYVGRSSFTMCDTLESINLPTTMKYIGGSAFHGNAKMAGKVIFDEGFSSLGSSAFNTTAITEVDIPGSAKAITKNAFYNCRSLTKITIREGITRLWDMAFLNCKAATITIPNSVTNIGSAVFSGDYVATKLVIGSGITEFAGTPFENCSGLLEVDCYGTTPPVYYQAYANRTPLFPANVYSNAKLRVPEGTKEAYEAALGWKDFTNVGTLGVSDVTADGFTVRPTADGLAMDGASYVEVFNAAGMRVYAGVASDIPVPPGIYIIRVAGQTFKVMR